MAGVLPVMKKSPRPTPRPRTRPAYLLPTAILEEVRGGQQPPTTVAASDDWLAPV